MFLGDDSQSKEIQSILLKAIYFCQLPRDIVENILNLLGILDNSPAITYIILLR